MLYKKIKCFHGVRKTRCKLCGGSEFCKHKKLKNHCRICKPSSFCTHNRRKDACRLCSPESWAKRILLSQKRWAKQKGYHPPLITPKGVLALIEESPLCCGCKAYLDYSKMGFSAPCLHHNHKTGEIIGFAHRECNALEGQLQKLGDRLETFFKNFFPQLVCK